jgi:dihydrofolate synthase/folylpolyglutamate synthase
MADKDFAACLRLVAPLCREIVFTRPEENRSAMPEQLAAEISDSRIKCHAIMPVAAALDYAAQLAGNGELICVAGSLYLVGRARAILLGGLSDA